MTKHRFLVIIAFGLAGGTVAMVAWMALAPLGRDPDEDRLAVEMPIRLVLYIMGWMAGRNLGQWIIDK